jgi:hypothetical protein
MIHDQFSISTPLKTISILLNGWPSIIIRLSRDHKRAGDQAIVNFTLLSKILLRSVHVEKNK